MTGTPTFFMTRNCIRRPFGSIAQKLRQHIRGPDQSLGLHLSLGLRSLLIERWLREAQAHSPACKNSRQQARCQAQVQHLAPETH
jgi:hypothetical protein